MMSEPFAGRPSRTRAPAAVSSRRKARSGRLMTTIRRPRLTPSLSRRGFSAKRAAFLSAVMSGQFAEDEALQIVGFRHAEQDRVVAALHPFLDDSNGHSRIHRRRIHDVGELRLIDVVRTAAGN